MNEFSTYEYAVKQRIEGKWILARIGLILSYITLVALWIVVGLLTRILVPLLAFIPLSLWVLVFITWRYTAVEYEYSVTSGLLTFAKIYGGRSRRKKAEFYLRDALKIAPLEDPDAAAYATRYQPEKEFNGVSSMRAADIYFALFEYTDKKAKKKYRAIYYFEATEKMLHLCRYYNPGGTVVKKVSR